MTDEPKTAEIVPYEVFAQRRLNRHALDNPGKPLNLPKPVALLDEGWDEPDAEDVPVMDRGRYWGPEYADPKQMLLTRYFSEQQSDPGDEI